MIIIIFTIQSCCLLVIASTITCINTQITTDQSATNVYFQNCQIINAQISVTQNAIPSHIAFSTFTNNLKNGLQFVTSTFSNTSITIENNIFNIFSSASSGYSAIDFNTINLNNVSLVIRNNIFNITQTSTAIQHYYTIQNSIYLITNNTFISQYIASLIFSSANIINTNFTITNNNIMSSYRLLYFVGTPITFTTMNISYNTFKTNKSSNSLFDYSWSGINPMFESNIYIVKNNMEINSSDAQNSNLVRIHSKIKDTTIQISHNTMNANFNVFQNGITESNNSKVLVFCNGNVSYIETCKMGTYSKHLSMSNTKSISPSITHSKSHPLTMSNSNSNAHSLAQTKSDSINISNTPSDDISNTSISSKTQTLALTKSMSKSFSSKSVSNTQSNTQSNIPSNTSSVTISPTKTLSKTHSSTSTKSIVPSTPQPKSPTIPQPQEQNNTKNIPTTIPQIATTATVSVVVTTITSPITALQMSRFSAVTALLRCNDIDEDASYSDYQIQASIGSTQFSTLSGSVFIASIGTTFVSFITFALHYTKTETKKWLHVVLRAGMALLLSYYTPSIMKDSLTILMYTNHMTIEFWLGSVSFFMICITMMTITATLVCNFKCHFTNDHFENTSDYPCKEYFLIFFTESGDIKSISKRCYYLVDLFCACVFSVIVIVRFDNSKDCTINAVVMLIVSFAYFLYTIIVRPYRELTESIINTANAFTQLILTILMVIYMANYDVLQYISIISLIISIQYICSSIIMVGKWIYKRCTAKQNDQNNDASPILVLDKIPPVFMINADENNEDDDNSDDNSDDVDNDLDNDVDMVIIDVKPENPLENINFDTNEAGFENDPFENDVDPDPLEDDHYDPENVTLSTDTSPSSRATSNGPPKHEQRDLMNDLENAYENTLDNDNQISLLLSIQLKNMDGLTSYSDPNMQVTSEKLTKFVYEHT